MKISVKPKRNLMHFEVQLKTKSHIKQSDKIYNRAKFKANKDKKGDVDL